jgi:hypothetical protein
LRRNPELGTFNANMVGRTFSSGYRVYARAMFTQFASSSSISMPVQRLCHLLGRKVVDVIDWRSVSEKLTIEARQMSDNNVGGGKASTSYMPVIYTSDAVQPRDESRGDGRGRGSGRNDGRGHGQNRSRHRQGARTDAKWEKTGTKTNVVATETRESIFLLPASCFLLPGEHQQAPDQDVDRH